MKTIEEIKTKWILFTTPQLVTMNNFPRRNFWSGFWDFLSFNLVGENILICLKMLMPIGCEKMQV